MRLHWSPRSPLVRMVTVAAYELGLRGRIALVRSAPPVAVNVGANVLGCALSYADFRFASLRWREGRPALAAWHEDFAARPSMRATAAVDD